MKCDLKLAHHYWELPLLLPLQNEQCAMCTDKELGLAKGHQSLYTHKGRNSAVPVHNFNINCV